VSSIRRILTLGLLDLKLTLRDRGNIFWLFLAPAIWIYFTGLMARAPASAGKEHATPLVVVDEDGSRESKGLIERLRSEGFEVKPAAPAETAPVKGRRLRIPKGLAAAFARDERMALKLVSNNGDDLVGDLDIQLKVHKAVMRFLADESFGSQEKPAEAVRLHSYWMHRRAIPVGYQQAVPGNLVLFLLMMTVASGAEIVARERRSGLLRRLAVSPLSRIELLAGKFLGRATTGAVEIAVFLLVGWGLFHVSWGASPVGLMFVLGSLLACAAALSLLVGAIFRSPEAASGVSIIVALIMAALGGCWWPSEITPEWLQRVGLVLPTGWAMEGLHRIMSWGGGVQDVLLPSAVLLAFALVAFLVAARRLRLEA
jgi:ABC-2 type transport system permease protein